MPASVLGTGTHMFSETHKREGRKKQGACLYLIATAEEERTLYCLTGVQHAKGTNKDYEIV